MSCDFYTQKMRKARKPHKCNLCKETIEPGQEYSHESGKFNGSIFENCLCKNCKDMQGAFFSINNDLDDGYTWDNVIDDINEIVCYQCRKENGDCKFGYYETPKCEKAKTEYLKFASNLKV